MFNLSSSSLRCWAAAGAAMVLSATMPAAELPILTKARARIGSEAAINAVNSIKYVGALIVADSADPTKQQRAAIEIVFQKEDKQRITATFEKLVDTTALDGYEAWQRKEDKLDKNKVQQGNLGPEQVKQLRANTRETLAFFRGLDARGGRIEDLGPASVEGVACQKVAFIHSPTIVFNRYFDLATGRLVLTETSSGSTLREQGEILAGGLRLPKTLITSTKSSTGQVQTVTIEVEKVTVNEVFPATFFSVPVMSARR
jgi:hypothetical protein